MTTPPSSSITLKIVKKDKNSPFLSIQTFIQRSLLHQQPIDIKQLWSKYKLLDAHSLLIKNHKLDYILFKELADIIIDTYQPYHLDLQPDDYYSHPKIMNDDLIPLDV